MSAPSSVDVLDLTAIHRSGSLSRARGRLPYPIARGARMVQLSTDAKDTYDAALRLGETVTTVLGIVSTVWARQYGVRTPQLEALQDAITSRGVTWGTWKDVAGSVERPMQQDAHALPGMVDGLRAARGGIPKLVADVKVLVEERNRSAHGAGPYTRVEAAERLHEFFPTLERLLDRVAFLGDLRWVLVNDVKLRRREGTFQVHASLAMGDHPDFETYEFDVPHGLAEGVFYLLTPEGPLDLTPLVVLRHCPTCHQPEVAYADKIDEKKGVALKSFDRGHVVFDPTLVDEARSLVASPPSRTADEAG